MLGAVCAFMLVAIAPGRAAVPGLVAAYGFDEGSGTAVADASGLGNNGTVAGAAWAAPGRFGKALRFDAARRTNAVTIADSASLDLTNGLTVEAWVNPDTLGAWRTAVMKERPGGLAYALYANNASSRPVGQISIGGTKSATGTAQLPLNAWSHVATTYDGATLRLYVDGTQVGSRAQTGSIAPSTGPLKIGGNGIWGEWFGGLIDEVRVYNRALTAAELQADMATPVGGGTPGDTTPPTAPTGLVQTGRTQTSVTVSWTASTDNVGVTGYGLYRDLAPAGTTTQTTATISGLSCGASPQVAVDAVDAAGNRSAQARITATTTACDTTPPTVSVSSPAPGSVTGTVTVSAGAADDTGVAGVRFRLDDANLGAEDTSAPYSVSWDTTTAANGAHTLTAVARDAAGNTTTSAPVAVTVANESAEFVTDTLIIGLDEPTDLEFTPDRRMLIAERDGTIWVAQPGANTVDPTPLLQLPGVQTADERGLLGIVLDPAFTINGWLYVFYTNASTQRNQVSRFTVVGNGATLASEQLIWRNDATADIWHQGGDLQFASDGSLYISVGDHLRPSTAQELDSYNGKILRVWSDGSVPADNPFVDGAGPNKDEIWLRGLRNPFRFTIDLPTGRMYIGDVGQGDWEEVDRGVRGANYGWPICEGTCGTAGMTNPIYTYAHTRDASITGGVVYRGTQFPGAYQGSYFFGDYSQNWIKRITLDASGGFSSLSPFIPANGAADGPYGDVVAFVTGPDGSLYYVDNGPFTANNAGSIRRVRNTSANQPPTAQASASVTTGPPPLAVSFSSAGSADPEGQPLAYSWDFGDGTSSTQANPSHTYAAAGRYTARLTTSDGTHSTASSPIAITVGQAPQATITAPANGLRFRAGETILFAGQATDPEDGTVPAARLAWKVVFRHEGHIHPFIDNVTGASGSFQVPSTGHSYSGNTSYEIVLTATDSDGIESQASVTVSPDKVLLTFRTEPAGLSLSVDGIPQSAPFVLDTLIGFRHAVEAPSPQTIGSNRYGFTSWSDGGARAHEVTVPSSAATLTATFALESTTPAGLVAAYSFDEGNGGTLYDASGNGNDGTLSGPVWTGTGRHGGALSFDGANDLVTIPDATSLDLTTGLTLEAWVNPTQLGPWRTVVFKERTGGMNYALYANDGAARPRGQVWLANAEQNAIGAAAVAVGAWTHLATTYDGATLRLYVNGTQVATRAITGALANTNGALRIGGNAIWGEYYAGQIDDVRVYQRALTPAEIQADMGVGVGG